MTARESGLGIVGKETVPSVAHELRMAPWHGLKVAEQVVVNKYGE